jgi:O-antigen/teichoic acid export membrane protein
MSGYVITYYFAHKIKLPKIKVSKSDIMLYGKGMLYLGMSLVIAQLLGNATTYGINIFISRMGGLSDLGLYNAGVNITMQSVMLVFSAMASDYFPRLVTSLKDNKLMNETVNQQTEIILYLAVPILSIMMVASPLIIRILLSKEFLAITGFIRILCLGMLLKAVSYSLGYISFAKGDKKVYMFLEGFYGNAVNLVLSIGLYYLWGLTGLAISFVIDYLQYYFVVSTVDRKRYGYQSDKTVSKLILVSISSITGMLVLVLYLT